MFEYLEEYFDKYAGRGLPVQIDTVLVTRLRNSASSSGVSKEDIKSIKNRLTDLEALRSKNKNELAEMRKKMGSMKPAGEKPSKEELDERRKNVTCHNCGKKGHYKSECPDLAESKGKDED